jgi:membrane-anchored protein YejM (alkaline phosphatase superfamily)
MRSLGRPAVHLKPSRANVRARTTNTPIMKSALFFSGSRNSIEPFFLNVHFNFPHEPDEKHSEFDCGDEPIDRYDSEVSFADQQIGKRAQLLGSLY